MYTKEEKLEIVHWYFNKNSLRNVRDLFAVKYPHRPIPSTGGIRNIIGTFKAAGGVVNEHKKRKRTSHVLTEEMKLNILVYIEENPMASLRSLAKEFGISTTSVRKTLKDFKYKPYDDDITMTEVKPEVTEFAITQSYCGFAFDENCVLKGGEYENASVAITETKLDIIDTQNIKLNFEDNNEFLNSNEFKYEPCDSKLEITEVKPEPTEFPIPQTYGVCSLDETTRILREASVRTTETNHNIIDVTENISNTGITLSASIKLNLDGRNELLGSTHNKESGEPSNETIKVKLSSTKKIKGNYKCEICNECYTTERCMLKHMEMHTSVKNYKCEICSNFYPTKTRLATHMKIHTSETSKCDICIKEFPSKQLLAEHMKMHTRERNYKCGICEKFFTTKERLTMHAKMHPTEGILKCDVCAKSFVTRAILANHMRRHVNSRCKICNRHFEKRKLLLEHKKTHGEEIAEERPLRKFPIDMQMSIRENFNKIRKRLITEEPARFVKQEKLVVDSDAIERKRSMGTNETHVDTAVNEEDSKSAGMFNLWQSLNNEIIIKEEENILL